ncbi:heavy metal translocating P-type ATPase [Ureaplasma canigenitalium]|uniref:heavy metal translocating P-type ATPase n=1 Tax=Ureaplasma canigenitalium TaxID=42092 RepID=UPI000691BDB6|nr:cation-translocating P-type ATPase [Ureaplasma canigenitalium]
MIEKELVLKQPSIAIENKSKLSLRDRWKKLPTTRKNYIKSLSITSIAMIISLPLMVFEMWFMFDTPSWLTIDQRIIYGWIVCAFSIVVIFGLGYSYFKNAFFEIFKWKKPGMNILIVLSTLSAFIYSTYLLIKITIDKQTTGHGFYETACMIIATMSVGFLVNDKIKLKANQDVKSLNDLQIKEYHFYDPVTKEVSTKKVFIAQIGDYCLVKKGEGIPLDGKLVSDSCEVDESSLTGEARPILKQVNDELIAGAINIGNPFIMQITKRFADSTIKKIINGVNKIANDKPKLMQIADKIAMIFTPIILLFAILGLLLQLYVPSLHNVNFLNLSHNNHINGNIDSYAATVDKAVYVFIAVLVISCPCAFGIAIPLSVLIGAARAAKNGIVYNNSQIFEKIKKINAVCFDKTGTLTHGKLVLDKVVGDYDYLSVMNSMEQVSIHPLAKAFVNYAQRNDIKPDESVTNIEEIAGVGIVAKKDNDTFHMISYKYARENGFIFDVDLTDEIKNQDALYSYVCLAKNKIVKTILIFVDQIREDAYETIKWLNSNGIKTYMITGDQYGAAKYIANKLNIKEFFYEVKPDEKQHIIKKIQDEGNVVMYVGDGINDLLALKQSDLSVSIGVHNKAVNAVSDINLLNPDIVNIIKIIQTTKYTRRFMISSLLWAFGYNIIFIPLAIVGIIPAFIAVFIMATSDIAVVLNSLIFKLMRIRLLTRKERNNKEYKVISKMEV